jgi:hypothetical protein
MTMLSEVAALDIEVNNRVSEGAAAAARDLQKVEDAADRAAVALKEVETGTKLVGDSFEKTAARTDALARAELRRAEIMVRAERETVALTAAAEREGGSADELAAAIAAVTLKRDADIAKAVRQAEVQRAQQLALVGGASAQTQALAAGTGAMDKYAASNDNGVSGVRRFSQAIGQAGFQVQDFVVQVGSGQSALVALGQQGSQLLGIFGSGGAIAGAVLAIAAMSAHLLLGKSAGEELKGAIEGIERSSQGALAEADRMESALRRQSSQFISGAAAGDRYRQGLQGMGDELVRLARYYERLTEVQRENERITLGLQQRALTTGGGSLQQDILRPVQGRISTAEGGAPFDMSGMGGGISQGSLSLENVPQELRAVTQAAMQFRDAGRLTVEGFQSLINSVAAAKAGSAEYRTELEAYEKRLIDLLPRVREFEEAQRRLGVAQTAIDPANAAQVALEGMRGVTGEVGGNYQTRQRILDQRRQLQAGLASGLATPDDRAAGRSSLQQLAQQEQGLTPATQQQLRALDEQARLSMVAEGAARDLAQAEMDLDRAARAAGAGMASATEKAQARALVQERLDRQLSQNITNLDRQIMGETAIAQSYAISAQEGRQMEAAVRASTDALKFGAEGTAEYASAVEQLTLKYYALNAAQAERQLAQRNSQSRDELAYLQREAELIGVSADARERELAALRARQAAGAAAGSDAAREAESLAVRLVDARRNTEQLRNNWSELSTIGERAFDRIGEAITQAFASGSTKAVNFGNIAKAVMSEVVQSVMKLAVVNPILNSLFGGSRGTLGGIMSVGGGILGLGNLGLGSNQEVVASTAGSTANALKEGQQTSSLMAIGRYGNLGSAFSGQGLANTGWGLADGFLNTPLVGSGGLVANVGTQTYQGLPVVNSFGMDGLSVAGGIGAAAGIGLGGLSVYQGIQKGGIGGGVGVAGGLAGMAGGAATIAGGVGAAAAAAGSTGMLATMAPMLSAAGPIGMIAAAVLAIVAALLPGEKPSGKGQEFRYNLGSGEVEKNGLSGNRFSAGNAEQAEAATMTIANLASEISGKLGGANIGGEIAVGVTSSRGDGPGNLYLDISGRKDQFTNDEEGSKQLAAKAGEYLLDLFKQYNTQDSDYAGILRASGSIEALGQNLEWYEGTYKALLDTTEATSAFGEQMKTLNTQWQAAIDKANELSLATDVLNSKRDDEIAKLEAARDLQLRGFGLNLNIRQLRATGGDASAAMQQAGLMQFDMQAEQEIVQAKSALEALGISAEQVAERVVWVEQTLALERLDVIKQFGEEAAALTTRQYEQAAQSAASVITSLADYARGLAYSDKSALSVQDQYGLAMSQYNAVSGAAMAGDAGSISKLQEYSETVLGAGRAMYGSGAEYAALFDRVTNVLGSVGNLSADTLTASFQAEIVREQSNFLGGKLDRLEAAVQQLITATKQSSNTPARAAA